MIKNNVIKRLTIASLALLSLLFIYLFPINDKEYSEKINYVDSLKMPIYLIDSNNYVSRINILKESEDVLENIKVIIDTLTINSNKNEYIPFGFRGIIPKNTILKSHSITDKILKLNFSKEFLEINKEDEIKLIESIVFSLCEFSEVEDIMIFIEDEKLTTLPHSNTILPTTLNKSYGINKIYNITNLKNTVHTINYYIGKTELETYYIPISSYSNSSLEKVEIIITNLKTSPINQTNLISYLKASATLEDYEILENSINVSFDNETIADLSDNNIIEEVKYSIYLSIRDTYNIKSVIFDIPSEKNVSVLLD